ncbi:hypothetical protein PTTG_27017 [Puccinia triticina 1-1 BBBD Race 1]|uniref:Uncharacterized protein n=1 Tax=Puccinia triticina (isolate 1-1 / race 1 (BBBD)) TaxID=630390 RepID=A0A180GPB7_PUCT1|nr:hypothetical protein PTTG_27017 [Puccinia triticina 1-1 BBBD Race 1]
MKHICLTYQIINFSATQYNGRLILRNPRARRRPSNWSHQRQTKDLKPCPTSLIQAAAASPILAASFSISIPAATFAISIPAATFAISIPAATAAALIPAATADFTSGPTAATISIPTATFAISIPTATFAISIPAAIFATTAAAPIPTATSAISQPLTCFAYSTITSTNPIVARANLDQSHKADHTGNQERAQ